MFDRSKPAKMTWVLFLEVQGPIGPEWVQLEESDTYGFSVMSQKAYNIAKYSGQKTKVMEREKHYRPVWLQRLFDRTRRFLVGLHSRWITVTMYETQVCYWPGGLTVADTIDRSGTAPTPLEVRPDPAWRPQETPPSHELTGWLDQYPATPGCTCGTPINCMSHSGVVNQ